MADSLNTVTNMSIDTEVTIATDETMVSNLAIQGEDEFCGRCKLWHLTSTASVKSHGIVRVQCAKYIDEHGERHGRICKEFQWFEGMTEGHLWCERFLK